MNFDFDPQKAIENFSFLHAFGVFLAYFLIDVLYALYTLAATRLQPLRAANMSGVIYFLGAFGVISYAGNFLYLIPLTIGAWLGTYVVIFWEARKKHDKKNSES